MKISIVIPTYDRPNQLMQCIGSLQRQEFESLEAEIVVVDDKADKKIQKMLQAFEQARFPVHYFSQQAKGPAAARNLGIKQAKADIIGFIDDDCIACENWLSLMYQAHIKHRECVAVGGDTLVGYESIAAQIGQFLSTCSIQTFIDSKLQTIFFPTCNVSIKKTLFKTIAFNEKFPLPGGEDLEFFWQAYKQGYKMYWDKNIKVLHYRDKSMKSFIRQAYNYGRGNYYVQYIHKDHPLLKEIKTGIVSFWAACLINILKIPRFSFILGKKMIAAGKNITGFDKIKIYVLFALHKIVYISGNIAEYLRILFKMDNPKKTARISKPTPQLLILDITHACNLQCRICDIWQTKEVEKDLDLKMIKSLLLQAKQLGISEIALSGGEPLLRKDIIEIIKYAAKLKIKNLGVLTNGILLADKFSELKPFLMDQTIAPVISLDSLDAKVHNYIRNSDQAHAKTMQAINKLIRLKKDHPRLKINIISIILNQNLSQLPMLAGHLKEIGVDSLQFQALLSNNLDMAQRKLSRFWVSADRFEMLDETIDKLIGMKKQQPDFIKNSVTNLTLLKKYFRGQLMKSDVQCVSADKTFLVSNRGHCTTCFSSYGDLQHKQLKQIMEDKQISSAQKAVKNCSWPCLLPCFCDK
jgi:molybdenum cofactor biosynthesis enzyme MoaA/glycosyltransferase involved in cell wall biosynthesis